MYQSMNPIGSEGGDSRAQSIVGMPGADPYEQYDSMHKKLIEAQKDKDELQRELNRLKDQRDLMRMKNSALSGDRVVGGQQADKKS